MDEGHTISTHVLDVGTGTPGVGYRVALYRMEGGAATGAGEGTTDTDGRIRRLLDGPLTAGEYRIDVEVGATFFQRASVTFMVEDTSRSYHVPFLVSPFSLSTYRGS